MLRFFDFSSVQIHQNNTQRITTFSTQINTSHATTTQQLTEIQQAQGNATQLLNDVTEAERKFDRLFAFCSTKDLSQYQFLTIIGFHLMFRDWILDMR